MTFFSLYEWKMLENMYNIKNYFRKSCIKKSSKYSLGILNKKFERSQNFQGIITKYETLWLF